MSCKISVPSPSAVSESKAYMGPTLTVSFRDLLKDGGSPTMTVRSQPISALQPDGHPSESIAYIGSNLDSYPLRVS